MSPRGTLSRSYLLLAAATAVSLTLGLQALAPAFPVVQEEFGIADFDVALLTSAYVLPGVLFAVPLGVAADLIGRKPLFAISGVFYGIMGFAQALAPTFGWLLVGRFCQGVAFAALMPLTVTIIGDAFTGLEQVRAQGQRQVAMALGNLLMPILGAQLALAAWFLPFTAQGVIIIPGLVALFVLGPHVRSGRTGSEYARRAWRSMVKRGFPSVLLLGFFRFFGRFSLIAYLPLHLTRELGTSLTTAGAIIGMATGIGFVSALFTARLSNSIRPSVMVFGSLLGVGFALIAIGTLESLAFVVSAVVIYGLSDGFISVLQSAYAARGTPESVRAGLVAVNGTARNAGKFVGPLALGGLAALTGVGPGFAVAGAVMVGCALILPRGLRLLDHVLSEEVSVAAF